MKSGASYFSLPLWPDREEIRDGVFKNVGPMRGPRPIAQSSFMIRFGALYLHWGPATGSHTVYAV